MILFNVFYGRPPDAHSSKPEDGLEETASRGERIITLGTHYGVYIIHNTLYVARCRLTMAAGKGPL
jgi:hypothetical protein